MNVNLTLTKDYRKNDCLLAGIALEAQLGLQMNEVPPESPNQKISSKMTYILRSQKLVGVSSVSEGLPADVL